jgi:hypothetical protein
MKKSDEYRQHAEECRALARKAQNEEQRAQLLKMAEAWESFAAERERALDGKSKKQPGTG